MMAQLMFVSKKHYLAKQNYDSFEINDDGLVHDMYSHLNLIINELHSIGLLKLDDVDIVRKIISMLSQKKYASIITILHNMDDLSTMTLGIVIGKLVAFEMSHKNGGGAKKKEKKQTSKLSNTYTNKVDKKASTPYLLKKKKNDKVVAIKLNKQVNNGVKRFWVPKEIISNIKSTKKVWIPKGK